MTTLRTSIVLMMLAGTVLLAAGCISESGKTPVVSVAMTSMPASGQDLPPWYWIRIDPIGDRKVNTGFTVTASTNLPAGTAVLAEVYPLPLISDKKQDSTFHGFLGTVEVTRGPGGTNSTSFVLDTTFFEPGMYRVTGSAAAENATGYADFTVTADEPGTTHPELIRTDAETYNAGEVVTFGLVNNSIATDGCIVAPCSYRVAFRQKDGSWQVLPEPVEPMDTTVEGPRPHSSCESVHFATTDWTPGRYRIQYSCNVSREFTLRNPQGVFIP